MTLRREHAGLSDTGRVRQENQDRWYADPQRGLYLVADGVGGGPAGALAAKIVVDALPALLAKQMAGIHDLAAPEAGSAVRTSLVELSNRLRSESRDQPGLAGMGSTVVLALVCDGQALIGHMGDSRAYLLRQGMLERLTQDHSIVELLIQSGDIRSEEAADHPARGQLTRFVGMEGEPLPETRLIEVGAGDTLLLCTDGLYGQVSEAFLRTALDEERDLEKACQRLIAAANEAGGKDNVTLVLVRLEAGAPATQAKHHTRTIGG